MRPRPFRRPSQPRSKHGLRARSVQASAFRGRQNAAPVFMGAERANRRALPAKTPGVYAHTCAAAPPKYYNTTRTVSETRRALSLASSNVSPRASATPMRRRPLSPGFPKRNKFVSGSANALSRFWKNRRLRYAFRQNDGGCRRSILPDTRNGQPKNGPRMQSEFGKIL